MVKPGCPPGPPCTAPPTRPDHPPTRQQSALRISSERQPAPVGNYDRYLGGELPTFIVVVGYSLSHQFFEWIHPLLIPFITVVG